VPARAAFRVLALGGAIAALAQLALPVGAPLYDSVPLLEPYRFASPGPNEVGGPTSYAGDVTVSNGKSPQITAATTEAPPQAQLIALEGAFAVPSGVTTLHVSIVPVAPAAPVPKGSISGNVYRISVAGPTGTAIPIATTQEPTIAMRSAGPLTDAAVFRFADGAWKQLDTVSNSSLSIYTVQPDALGDFAVVDLGPAGLTTTDLVIVGTVGILVAALAIWAIRQWRRRRAIALEAEQSRRAWPTGHAPRGGPPRSGPQRGAPPRGSGPPKRRR
jgi:hypothetical protein